VASKLRGSFRMLRSAVPPVDDHGIRLFDELA